MNLFSHIYFAKDPLDNPYYVAGLLYPDISRNRRREIFSNESFQKGIDEHNETAKVFHSQEWFKKEAHKLARTHNGFKFKKKSILYHWGMEIAIDYHLQQDSNSGSERVIFEAENILKDEEFQEYIAEEDSRAAKIYGLLLNNSRLGSYKNTYGCVYALKRTFTSFIDMYPNLAVEDNGDLLKIITRSQKIVEPRMSYIKELFGK